MRHGFAGFFNILCQRNGNLWHQGSYFFYGDNIDRLFTLIAFIFFFFNSSLFFLKKGERAKCNARSWASEMTGTVRSSLS